MYPQKIQSFQSSIFKFNAYQIKKLINLSGWVRVSIFNYQLSSGFILGLWRELHLNQNHLNLDCYLLSLRTNWQLFGNEKKSKNEEPPTWLKQMRNHRLENVGCIFPYQSNEKISTFIKCFAFYAYIIISQIPFTIMRTIVVCIYNRSAGYERYERRVCVFLVDVYNFFLIFFLSPGFENQEFFYFSLFSVRPIISMFIEKCFGNQFKVMRQLTARNGLNSNVN